MEFPGPWPLSTNACEKAADCQWFEDSRFMRGVCAELSAASLSTFTEASSNFSSKYGARMCTCDPRLSLSGNMCDIESTQTLAYRYTRVAIIAVQAYLLWVGLDVVFQARKRRALRVNPMWVSHILTLIGCGTEMVWNASFAVSSIGALGPLAQLIAQVGGKIFFIIATCCTSAAILLLSIVWIVVLQARKSGLVMNGRLSKPTYAIACFTSVLLVLVVAVLNSVKTFKVSSFSGVPFVCIIAFMYGLVLYRIRQVKKKLAQLDKTMSLSPSRDIEHGGGINKPTNFKRPASAISPSRKYNGAPAAGIVKAFQQSSRDVNRTLSDADEDEEDDDDAAASADPYASNKRSANYLLSTLSEVLLPFVRTSSAASTGRSSGTPSRASSTLDQSSARSTGASTNIPDRPSAAMVSAADLEALRARNAAGLLRTHGSSSTSSTRVRVKRASILMQSLDHMSLASAAMLASMLVVAVGAIGVALTVENYELRGLAPLFSLIFSISLVMIHLTIIYFVRSAHTNAVRYRRWRRWLRNNPDPITDETKPSYVDQDQATENDAGNEEHHDDEHHHEDDDDDDDDEDDDEDDEDDDQDEQEECREDRGKERSRRDRHSRKSSRRGAQA
ncbi:Hypothetical Protein FCC1311_018732 [Hondaea fermentalgiana]|uniref:Uncharacterized protein n=1 Tax=Hondaea fermentalgiana TaxID=2315210 RepID=A0A2R5GCZ8_9STRA|nr:Hypothetical Protein FCC1311_018732 [Hondaea fermentalgiana]|eukprot:GBG25654.1 Hypothetical Protein FCC1311_018732 [Hondaea fermentalgiana]